MFEGFISQISALLHSYVGKTLQNQTMTWTKMMDSMLPQLPGAQIRLWFLPNGSNSWGAGLVELIVAWHPRRLRFKGSVG